MALLSELLEEKFATEDGFRIDFSGLAGKLPSYVPLDRIEVDLETVLRICRITRVYSLEVLGFGEKGEDEFDIRGIDGGGGAVGTVNSKQPADKMAIGPVKTTNEVDLLSADGRTFDFRYSKISINLENNKDFPDLRDPHRWAQLLDKAMKEQLMEMAKKRLGFDFKKFAKEITLPVTILPYLLSISLGKRHPLNLMAIFSSSLLSGYLYYSILAGEFWNYYLSIFVLGKYMALRSATLLAIRSPHLRKSLLNPLTLGDFEYDRLLIVWHLLRTRTLVSAATTENQNEK